MNRRHAFEAIGHRGCEGHAPGNSMDAINVAIALGIDRIEVDVRQTADGRLVLFHDASVNGVQVEAMTRDELLAATSKDDRAIPFLEEALLACKGKTRVQLELKTPGMAGAVHSMVSQTGFPVHDLHVSSFDAGELAKARDEFGKEIVPVQLVYLFGGIPNRLMTRRASRHGAGTISLKAKRVTATKVSWLHDRGFRVIAFGLGDARTSSTGDVKRLYRDLVDAGLDGFTCAFPDIARNVAKQARDIP